MAVDGIGRPSKGHRIRLTTRVPPQTARQAALRAKANGVTISEWMADVIQASVKQ